METWIPQFVGSGRFGVRGVAWRGRDHLQLTVWDTRLAVPRQLKVLRPEVRRDQVARARLVNEARMLTQISHPQVLRAFDLVPDSDVGAALVVQAVDAQPLEMLLRNQGRLAPDLALRVAQDVLSAIAQCHVQGVLHGSVDGDSVLVRHDGRCLLSNFGSASFAELTSDTLQPDLNAVAILVFKMLAGHDGGDLAAAAVNPQLPVWNSLPTAVAPVVRRGLHPIATHQYPSAHAMYADLQRAMSVTPLTPPPRRMA